MRKNIVAGNWKMNTTVPEGVALAKEINGCLAGKKVNCEVIICVPATHLVPVNEVIDKSLVGLGAENCSEHAKGAYTGEIAADMIASTGAGFVILGHSERRQYFGENNQQLMGNTIAQKATGYVQNGNKFPDWIDGPMGLYFGYKHNQTELSPFANKAAGHPLVDNPRLTQLPGYPGYSGLPQ